jgi:hypothetical protein
LAFSDFMQLTQMVVQSFIRIIFTSQDAIFFWLIVLLLAMRSDHTRKTMEAWSGSSGYPAWQHTLWVVASGLTGGLAGSFLMVLVGINLADIKKINMPMALSDLIFISGVIMLNLLSFSFVKFYPLLPARAEVISGTFDPVSLQSSGPANRR